MTRISFRFYLYRSLVLKNLALASHVMCAFCMLCPRCCIILSSMWTWFLSDSMILCSKINLKHLDILLTNWSKRQYISHYVTRARWREPGVEPPQTGSGTELWQETSPSTLPVTWSLMPVICHWREDIKWLRELLKQQERKIITHWFDFSTSSFEMCKTENLIPLNDIKNLGNITCLPSQVLCIYTWTK